MVARLRFPSREYHSAKRLTARRRNIPRTHTCSVVGSRSLYDSTSGFYLRVQRMQADQTTHKVQRSNIFRATGISLVLSTGTGSLPR